MSPLKDIEIDNIYNNCISELNINKNGIKQLHETICTFIKSNKSKEEKRKLKSAHWLFRKGSISDACKTHTLFADAVVNNMEDTELSRDFIKKRTDISFLVNHLENGIACGSVENYINNISDKLENIIQDLSLLKTKLNMSTKGISRNTSKEEEIKNLDNNV